MTAPSSPPLDLRTIGLAVLGGRHVGSGQDLELAVRQFLGRIPEDRMPEAVRDLAGAFLRGLDQERRAPLAAGPPLAPSKGPHLLDVVRRIWLTQGACEPEELIRRVLADPDGSRFDAPDVRLRCGDFVQKARPVLTPDRKEAAAGHSFKVTSIHAQWPELEFTMLLTPEGRKVLGDCTEADLRYDVERLEGVRADINRKQGRSRRLMADLHACSQKAGRTLMVRELPDEVLAKYCVPGATS